MAKKFSQKEWIQKAKSIWKNTYDYKKVKYINSKTKVQLICKIKKHGSFWTLPYNHTGKKYGCPKCGKTKYIKSLTKTFETFKKEAKEIHHKKYTYDNTSYKSARVKTKIVCKIHGEFWQTPDAHINRKQGCKKCGEENYSLRKKNQTIEQINKFLKKKYKNKISLITSSFRSINQNSFFKCKTHGKFKRLVSSVIYPKNHACKICGLKRGEIYQHDNLSFNELIKLKVGKKYKIFTPDYKGRETRIKLGCNKHGIFYTNKDSIYRFKGCPVCTRIINQPKRNKGIKKFVKDSKNSRFKKWLEKAIKKHGKFYDYSKVNYLTGRTNVQIICPEHGLFKQVAGTHLNAGCRKCADEDLNGLYSELYFKKYFQKKSMPGVLYYVRIKHNNDIFYKVGITINNTKKRLATIDKKKFKINIIAEKKDKIYNCFKKEKLILNSHVYKCRYTKRIKNFTGHSECFTKPISKKIYGKIFN